MPKCLESDKRSSAAQAVGPLRARRWLCVGSFGALLLAAGVCRANPQIVPIAFIDGLPVVNVRLGAINADFLLDTGGQIGITVPEPLINSATHVTLRDEREKRGDAAGRTFLVQKLTARSVRLGTTELGPVDGLVNYEWGLTVRGKDVSDATRKGVIGLEALSSKNLLLDLAHGTMHLFDRGGGVGPDLSDWDKAPFEYDARGVVVTLMVKDVPLAFSLDTAATLSVIKSNAAIFAQVRPPCSGKARNENFCRMAKLRQVEMGGAKLGDIAVAVVRMKGVPFDGLLGADFFRHRKVFLDFDTRTIFIEGPERQESPVSDS